SAQAVTGKRARPFGAAPFSYALRRCGACEAPTGWGRRYPCGSDCSAIVVGIHPLGAAAPISIVNGPCEFGDTRLAVRLAALAGHVNGHCDGPAVGCSDKADIAGRIVERDRECVGWGER